MKGITVFWLDICVFISDIKPVGCSFVCVQGVPTVIEGKLLRKFSGQKMNSYSTS